MNTDIMTIKESSTLSGLIAAHGLHMIAPPSNEELAEQIIAGGGALLSEHEPDVPPRPPEFVKRNRIQSGMSLCSIIVESGEKGGAIHQAQFTKDQGRPVFVVWPDEAQLVQSDFNSDGANYLINELGAIRIRNANEMIDQVSQIEQTQTHSNVRSDAVKQLAMKF